MDKKYSDLIYRWKAVALVSIVMAHSWFTNIDNMFLVNICTRFTRWGVFTFFMLSGFFFCPHKTTVKIFWKKKLRSIILPWVVGGLINYFIRFKSMDFYFSPIDIFNYIIGNGSWLYWITMLLMCYVLFWKICDNTIALLLAIFVNVVSIILTASGILPNVVNNDVMAFSYINPYLNVFNWGGIFALGILLNKKRILIGIFECWNNKTYKITTIVFGLIVWIASSIYDVNYEYWSYWGLFSELVMSFSAGALVFEIQSKHLTNVLEMIGTITMPIYLYHMPIQDKVFPSVQLLKCFPIAFVRPVVTVIICSSIIILLDRLTLIISTKLHTSYRLLIGIRTQK